MQLVSKILNVRPLCTSEGIRELSDISIIDGRIARIDPARGNDSRRSERVVDGRGAICMPGLVNSHNHSPLMIVRGMIEDLGFAPAYVSGVPQGHWLSGEESLLLARLGVMEMMMAGATTIVDYYLKPESLARAAHEMGVRAFVGGRVMDANPAALSEGRFVRDRTTGDATLTEALDLIEKWEGTERISTILAPHAPDTCSRTLLEEFALLASSTGKQIHTHLAQSQMEVDHILTREGMTPAELLDDVGLLTSNLIAAHCIFLSQDDIQRVGRNQVAVAHAPIGNASFGAAAPIMALEQAGARITLCTDTKSADMFEAMRMAIASARWRAGMQFVLNARHVFNWATTAGAAALGGQGSCATLALGAPADMILLDPEAPNLHPVVDGFGIVVHSGCAANVRTVICGGEILVQDRQPTRVDPTAVIAEAELVAKGLWRRAHG